MFLKRLLNILFVFSGFCLGFLFAPAAWSQPQTATFRTQEGIYLRWQGFSGADFEGYHIYRAADNGDWERINEEILSVSLSFNDIMSRAGRFYGGLYMGLFTDTDEERDITQQEKINALTNPSVYSFISLMSITQYPVGILLGEVFFDNGVPEQTGMVQYRITLMRDGQESEYASIPPFNPFIYDAVPGVDSLWASPMDRSAVIYWERKPEFLSTGVVTAYNLYRSQSRIGPWERVNATTILPVSLRGENPENGEEDIQNHLDRFLENNQEYFYHVRALNSFGIESAPSAILRVVPGDSYPPRPPRGLHGEVFGGAVRLNWEYENDEHILGFQIFKATDRRDEFEKVFPLTELQLDAGIREYIDLEVEPGNAFYYFLRAVGQNGLISEPSDTLTYFYVDNLPPLPPQNVKAEADSLRILISWSPNTESDLLGYEIERAGDKSLQRRFLMNRQILTDTLFIDSFPVNNPTLYGYWVYALDRSMNRSRASEKVTARLKDITPPSAPFIHALIQQDGEIVLQWSQNPEADLHSYRIYRAIEDSLRLRFHTGRRENMLLETIANPGVYYYAVSAVDSSGNESKRSHVAWIEIKEGPPLPPPSGIAQRNNAGHVELQWEQSSSAELAGYIIKRVESIGNVTIDLAQLKAEENSFIDRTIPGQGDFHYLVYAFNVSWQVSEPLLLRIE